MDEQMDLGNTAEITYRLEGRIVDVSTGHGVAGVHVELWDHEEVCRDLVAVAKTDSLGDFSVALKSSYLDTILLDRRPPLAFRLYTNGQLSPPSVTWDLSAEPAHIRIGVTPTITNVNIQPSSFVVRGRVAKPNGSPMHSAIVRAYDKGLSTDTLLGDAIADSQGRYRIAYPHSPLGRAGKLHADLLVRAIDGTTNDVIAESDEICHAPTTAIVDLVRGNARMRGVAEFNRLYEAVVSVLLTESLADLTEERISYVACTTGESRDLVALLSKAAWLAREIALGVAGISNVAIFYGLLREGLPQEARKILSQRPARLREALVRAVARNILEAPATTEELNSVLDTVIEAFLVKMVDIALVPRAAGGGCMGDALAPVLADIDAQREFVRKAITHEGELLAFWTTLAASPTFSASGLIDKLKRTMQTGAITRFHAPLVAELDARFERAALTSIRDLAGYDETDWEVILDGNAPGTTTPISCPADIPGADESERRANYAKLLASSVATAFPTAVIANRIKRQEATASDITAFFDQNPDFELGTMRVSSYLMQNSSAMTGVSNVPDTTAHLKKIERIFRITRSYEDIELMLNAGLHSAQSIVRMGKARLARKFQNRDAQWVEQIHKRACWIASATTSLLGQYASGANGPLMPALPDLVSPAGSPHAVIADFATLFGTLDGCACEHCRSVYGPAAYLVDLLEFIDHYESGLQGPDSTHYTARDLLLGPLNVPGSTLKGRRPDIARLLLSCENTNTALPYIDLVNEILEVSVANVAVDPDFDWSTHITSTRSTADLLAEPEIVYPKARHAAYVALSNAAFPFGLPFDLWTEEARIYLDHLGVSREELQETLIATKKNPPANIGMAIARERLRMSKREWEILTQTNSPPSTADCWGVTSLASLNLVSTFLKRAGISFEELRELLATHYVNPSEPATVTLVPEDGCDIEAKQLSGLSETILGRMHRFLRLRKRLGLRITELDQILSTFGATDTGEALLGKVADLLALREKLNLALPSLLSFWGPLETRTTEWVQSTYDALFIDPSVPSQLNPFVTHSGTVLESAPGVLAGLGIDAVEFGILAIPDIAFALTGATSALDVGAPLSVANLSRMHRIVTLARALGLSIRDFWVLHSLSGRNALLGDSAADATPAETRAFVALVESVQQSKLTIAEISYLVRHVQLLGTSVVRSEEELAALVTAIENGVREIEKAQEDAPPPAPTPPPQQTKADILRNDVAGFVTQTLAAALRLEPEVMAHLLEHALPGAFDQAKVAIHDFLPAPLPAPETEHRKATLRLLEKAALLIARLGLNAAELKALYPNASSTDWLALGSLPLIVDASAASYTARFAAMVRLFELAAVREALAGKHEALVAVLKASTLADVYKELGNQTGWTQKDMDDWATQAFAPDAPLAADYKNEQILGRMQRAFAVFKRLGVSAKQAFSWTEIDLAAPPEPPALDDPPPNPNDPLPPPNAATLALDIKRVARAKHDAAGWTEVARPLRNVLREKQRDALVGYLVAKSNVAGPNELFDKLLIDVEMSPCQLTSRIKQAISSVQTFVQRALFGLERQEHIEPNEDVAHEWEWMKSYRVWEANRKVFLYPENWIQPELRDDKTPFFKAFESRLLQGEMTADAAEGAFRQYLEMLHKIARLEIAALYHEREDGDDPVDIVHVIARTAAAPHEYFYRRRVDSRYWTPWEKVDLEIQGDHLLATVWNRRLYLFWPVFEMRLEGKAERTIINLAWSHLTSEGFAGVKTTREETVTLFPAPQRADISLTASRDGDTLRVECLRSLHQVKYTNIGGFSLDPCTGEMVPAKWIGAAFAAWMPIGSRPVCMSLKELSDSEKENRVPDDFDELAVPMDKPVTLLKATTGQFSVHLDRSLENLYLGLSGRDVLFYADKKRTFFLDSHSPSTAPWRPIILLPFPSPPPPVAQDLGSGILEPVFQWSSEIEVDFSVGAGADIAAEPLYRFHNFYHPYVCDFVRNLERDGIDGLLRWSTQGANPLQMASAQIKDEYGPTIAVAQPFPLENVDFSYTGSYSQYNWELFFHAPFLIATRLSKNARYDEADRWFRYIFDPTGAAPGEGPERFWNVKPFRENLNLASIQEDLVQLAEENQNAEVLQDLFSAAFESGGVKDLAVQIALWRKNPFNPHLIARMRPLAYQKAVVMQYIENLIAWGDSLFRRETIEAINEATQLYILASQILGERPRLMKERNVPLKTYAELEPQIDAFSNALVEIESLVPPAPSGNLLCGRRERPPVLRTLYFCIPQNEEMLALWDTVADRLFKIRHCMNIDGTVRQLPLFEPPIDPALIVKAAAAGVDFGSVLSDVTAPLPIYRFSVLQSKAMEFASGVVAMGGALLSTLEKRDGEGLSRMRARHESTMLSAVRDVRKRQVDEAKEALEGVRRSRAVVEARLNHYNSLEPRLPEELEQRYKLADAKANTWRSQERQALAGVLKLIPQFIAGFGAGSEFGGAQLGGVAEVTGQYYGMLASEDAADASMVGIEAGYKRRAEDWQLQKDLAEKELVQFDRQIAAAEIRLEIAKKELANHDLSIKNAKEAEDYLKTKYTNEELYDWMLTEVHGVYVQAYKLAFEMARRAEKAFQFELGKPEASYVTFGVWDNAKKGLLAGEKLQHDLRRMEAAYLDQNIREYEITKHISLAEVDPDALMKLREVGTCEIVLPEWLFDMDWPGHYLRRIKSVSVTVPVVNGPYVGVNCRLTLQESHVRKTKDAAVPYPRNGIGDARFIDYGVTDTIVTSTGQNDAGLFELQFRDERYLPFEGNGVDSKWQVELEPSRNRFELSAVQDLVMHIRYTARDGGGTLEGDAEQNLGNVAPKGKRLFSAKTDFPEAWHAFVTGAGAPTLRTLELPIARRHFQSLLGNRDLKMATLRLFAKRSDGTDSALPMEIRGPGEAFAASFTSTRTLEKSVSEYGEVLLFNASLLPTSAAIRPETHAQFAAWKLRVEATSVTTGLDDIWVLCEYEKQ